MPRVSDARSLGARSPALWPDIEAELTSILGRVDAARLQRCWLRVATLLSLPADKLRAADRIADLPAWRATVRAFATVLRIWSTP
jgi:hypothetical protein